MEPVTFDTTMWGLLVQSDFMTKIVLFSLFVMSILCWAIFLYKFILLRIKKQQCYTMLEAMTKASSMSELYSVLALYSKTFPGYVLAQHLMMFKKVSEKSAQDAFDIVEQHGSHVIENLIYKEEKYVSVLSVSAAVSPLLGLFGTVWGLIHSFMRIAQKQSADIVTVAPGISEALITTLVGLMIAIPAVMLFYYIQTQIKSVEHCLFQVAEKAMVIMRLHNNEGVASENMQPEADISMDME